MPLINMSSISSKFEAFTKTDECKKMVKDKINEYVSSGVKKTASGSYILTEERMRDIADQLILCIQRVVIMYNRTHDIPDDMLDLFDYLRHDDPRRVISAGGLEGYLINLSFNVDLYRPSLEPQNWDGVDNIIKLFDEGYCTTQFFDSRGVRHNKQVRGEWKTIGKVVYSTPYRRHLGFMQEAIDEFNEMYDGVAEATLVW